jgi:RNA polymerase sigma factor (sigma-70 family)
MGKGGVVSPDGAGSFQSAFAEAGNLLATESPRHVEAYDAIFVAHHERVVGVLSRLLGDPLRAEEMANEVFWRAYRRYSATMEGSRLAGWLYRTAANLGISELRAVARRRRYEDAAAKTIHAAEPNQTPLDDLLREEARARVRSALASLKRWQARILILRASGLSYAELAGALRVRRSSIGTMLARAESRFQAQYLLLNGSEE